MRDLRHHKSGLIVRIMTLLCPPPKRLIFEERHWQRAANAKNTAKRKGQP